MVQYDTIKLRQPSSVSFVVVVLIDQILQVGITEHTLRQSMREGIYGVALQSKIKRDKRFKTC